MQVDCRLALRLTGADLININVTTFCVPSLSA
jgi:hypothetical protein